MLLIGSCAGMQSKSSQSALLDMHIEPANARLYQAGRFMASARALEKNPLELVPGEYFFTVKAPDHFPHDLRLDLRPGPSKVSIKLRPIPP